jgi:hypothetical protein
MKLLVHQHYLQEAHDILWIAFHWPPSTKGFAYWKAVVKNLQYNGAVDNGSHQLTNTDPKEIVKSCNEFLVRLDAAFVWADSPQGANYWSGVHDDILDIIKALGHKVVKKSKKDPIKAYDRAMKGI